MPHWSDFLDFNLLRPSAFERRHLQDRPQRPTSTLSLPNSLLSYSYPVTGTAGPGPGFLSSSSSSSSSSAPRDRRQSLDIRRPPTFVISSPVAVSLHRHSASVVSTSSTLTASGDARRSNFFSSRLLLPGAAGRGTSLDLPSTSASASSASSSLAPPSPQRPLSHSPPQRETRFSRPSFLRGNSWNGPSSGHRRLGSSLSRERDGSREREMEEALPEERSFVFMARPSTGIDMTPRTERVRRRHADEEEEPQTRGEEGQDHRDGDQGPVGTIPCQDATSAENATITDHVAIPIPPRTSTMDPETRIPTAEPRPSIAESIREEGILFQRQLTPAQRRLHSQRDYLKKFMCVIATMPVIATLAVYNKLEMVMWWVIAFPLLGIGLALIWRRRLGIKLQRLDEEVARAIPSLPNASSSQTRVLRSTQAEDAEPQPPPDYQSSIITPPAYIIQPPRKVPSYRSLENLFAFARSGGRATRTGAAVSPPEQATHIRDPETLQDPSSGDHTTSAGGEEASLATTRPTPQVVIHMPEMVEAGTGFGDNTVRMLDQISNQDQGSTIVAVISTPQEQPNKDSDPSNEKTVQTLSVASMTTGQAKPEQSSSGSSSKTIPILLQDATGMNSSASTSSSTSTSPSSSPSIEHTVHDHTLLPGAKDVTAGGGSRDRKGKTPQR